MDGANDSAPSSPLDSPPSSPLSMRSKSPTPPCDYPSPSLTQLSGSRSPSKSRDPPSSTGDMDGAPPPKKRKIAEVKPRTTEYLDMSAVDESVDRDSKEGIQLQRLLKALRKKQKIVVIAGAGISVSAGIPDFRSSTGLFKTLRSQHKLKASGKHLFDASVYKTDSSTASFHDMVRELSHLTRNAQPTLFHHMLATLAEEGRLLRLYTQNVDGIDTSLKPLETNVPLNPKGPWPKTIQLHGGLEKMVCTKCGELSDFDGALFEGPEPPACKQCEVMDNLRTTIANKRSHGIGRLRPRIVLYNEFNPDEEAIGAVTRADLRSRPDCVIVVGTSLKVPGVRRIAREMCAVARGRRNGFTVWMNNGPEPLGPDFKDCWDLVVRGDCEEVARLNNIPKWDEKDVGSFNDCTGQDTAKTDIKVEIEAKHIAVTQTQGILTPTSSPRNQSPTRKPLPTKMKQPKLNFGAATASNTESTPGKQPKAAKKPGEKRKYVRKNPATKPAKPANRITNTFSTTKFVKTPAGKPAPVSDTDSSPPQTLPPLFPNLHVKVPAHPMRPLSPAEVRNNTDTSVHTPQDSKIHHDLDFQKQTSVFAVEVEQQSQSRRETISPKGNLPSNMAHLLDG